MATTTPNYGWSVPTSTDLVKDGAVAIETLGDSADATVKALNPETTLGDLAYRSATANTKTRLGIGTTSQILTVVGGVPAWSTPAAAASGMTLITRNAFTAQSSVTIDNIFSSSYFTYLFNYKIFGSASTSVTLQGVYSGTVQTGLTTSWAYAGRDRGGNTRTGNGTDEASAVIGLYQAGENDSCLGSITWSNVGNSSQKPLWTGSVNSSVCWATVLGGFISTAQTYTGVKLAGITGTISGYVEVYGLAKA